MYRKRAMKILITVILSFSIIISCSFSCFAARTFFEVGSKDWLIATDKISVGQYPDKIPSVGACDVPEVFQHSELNGSYFVVSRLWEDYDYIDTVNFNFPDVPSSVTDDAYVVFEYRDSFILITFDSSQIHLCYHYDNETFFLYNVRTGISSTCNEYYLSYPFTDWVPFGFSEVRTTLSLSYYNVKYHNVPLYDFVSPNLVYISAMTSSLTSESVSKTLEKTLSAVKGALYCSIPADVCKKLSKRNTSFVLEKFGFICTEPTSFVTYDYDFSVRLNGALFGTVDFCHYSYSGFLNDEFLDAGYASINDYSYPIDFSELDFSSSDASIDIIITFTFYTSGFNYVFPGSFKIVDYSDYFEEQQNKEVINSITSVGGQLTTEIGNATTEITDSIDSLNDNIEYILTGDIELEQPDMNTDELDKLVVEQDEIVADILSSLDSDITNFVPSGYSSYTEYLIDNINSFKSDEYFSAFEFVRATFDNLVASLSILPLLLFSLTFGFAVFALGRRLN